MSGEPVIVELPIEGLFSLGESICFLEGFAPAGTHAAVRQMPALAFPVEGDWWTAGAIVRQRGGRVTAVVHGDVDPEAVRVQLRRLLSLDVEAGPTARRRFGPR